LVDPHEQLVEKVLGSPAVNVDETGWFTAHDPRASPATIGDYGDRRDTCRYRQSLLATGVVKGGGRFGASRPAGAQDERQSDQHDAEHGRHA
jgi:hypothetical protein